MKILSRHNILALPLIILSLLAVSSVGFCEEKKEPSDTLASTAETGRQIFLKNCAACHGANAEGNGPLAAALKVAPANLTTITKRHGDKFPDGEVAAYIDGRTAVNAHGTREMPIWGDAFTHQAGSAAPLAEEVTRGKITVLVEYLRSIQK